MDNENTAVNDEVRERYLQGVQDQAKAFSQGKAPGFIADVALNLIYHIFSMVPKEHRENVKKVMLTDLAQIFNLIQNETKS